MTWRHLIAIVAWPLAVAYVLTYILAHRGHRRMHP